MIKEFLSGKLIPILIVIIIALGGTVWYQQQRISSTMGLYTTSVANEKAAEEGLVVYRDKYNREHAKTKVYTKTVTELKASEDLLTKKLLTTISDSKIKLKNVTQAGIISTNIDTTLTDTLRVSVEVFPDTTIDLSTKDVTNIITIKDRKISSQIALDNEQTIITAQHKETIKPRKKFFLWRWFQKKHWVTEVEIVNSNPLIKTKEQKFFILPENNKSQ